MVCKVTTYIKNNEQNIFNNHHIIALHLRSNGATNNCKEHGAVDVCA